MKTGKKWIAISTLVCSAASAGELYVYYTERGPLVLTEPLNQPQVAGEPALDLIERSILRAANQYQLDSELIRAVIAVESGFDPQAVSPKGAMGLMQLMPTLANAYAVKDPFDVEENITAGSRFLSELMRKYGDLRLALAAYNAGEPAVDAQGGVPNYPETRAYIDKVLARYQP